ncbi:MAG: flagellin FliC [Halobacteriovoraceae bacterium]|jgi:flagellin|nr:flagellin FliC [Halobacteriovoraceae bacterium]
MALRINTNTQSNAAQRSLSEVKRHQSLNLERLASGQRINKASDDAAGLAISEKLKAHIRGSRQATRNASDGISLIQTAEGGLHEVNNILVRLRELSIQSASDTVGDKERAYTDMEFQQLTTEVERIANSTRFNDKSLLNGEGETMEFQIGIYNNADQDRLNYKPQESSVTVSNLGMDGMNVATKGDSQENLEKIDGAINVVNTNRAQLGALQNRMQSTIRNLEVQSENLESANSRIRDTDIAHESAQLAKNNILTASSTSVLAQANTSQSGALKLLG